MRRRTTIIVAAALALLAFTSPGAHAATADDPAATAAQTRDAGARQKPRTPGQRRRCRRGATRKTSGTRRGGTSKAKAKTKACAKTKTKKKTKPKAKPKPKPSTPGTTTPSGDTGTTAPAQDGGSTGTTPSGGGSTPAGGGETTTPELNAVGVKAYDRSGTFVFETTRSTVRAGELTVSFHNYDLDDHNLWFEGTSPLVSPVKLSDAIPLHGDVTTTVTVSAGAYRFFCTVPGHSTMTKALTVQ